MSRGDLEQITSQQRPLIQEHQVPNMTIESSGLEFHRQPMRESEERTFPRDPLPRLLETALVKFDRVGQNPDDGSMSVARSGDRPQPRCMRQLEPADANPMSKQRKKNRPEKAQRRKRLSPTSGEDPRSVAVTVGWMMSTLATGFAVCLSTLAYLFVRSMAAEDVARNPLAALPGLLLFTALVTSVLTLALIPIVYRVRPTKPPPLVTVGSVCVAIAPWIAVLVFILR